MYILNLHVGGLLKNKYLPYYLLSNLIQVIEKYDDSFRYCISYLHTEGRTYLPQIVCYQ